MDEKEEPKGDQPETSARALTGVSKDSTPTQPATEQQLRETEQKIEEQIEERMTAFERSMIRLTRFGLAVTILTGIIFAGQLYEMISGGTQTDKLVDYTNGQAESAKDIAIAASDQVDAANNFADTAEDIN
jgi:hypothetical protein